MKDSIEVKQATKILKVSYGYYISTRRTYPLINLAGLYLTTFDFQVGDRVKVEMTNRKLTITKIDTSTPGQKQLPLV